MWWDVRLGWCQRVMPTLIFIKSLQVRRNGIEVSSVRVLNALESSLVRVVNALERLISKRTIATIRRPADS